MMVHPKNYETVSTFVKVMQKKNRSLFFSGHGVDVWYFLYRRNVWPECILIHAAFRGRDPVDAVICRDKYDSICALGVRDKSV